MNTKQLPENRLTKSDSKGKAPRKPVLRFSPTAWAKLLFMRDAGNTEVGGFGITADDDPLHIIDFMTVEQENTVASVSFKDEAVADLFETQVVDNNRQPENFARIWCHSHPGDSPSPSMTDEETFKRVFGKCDWAVMFILAQGGKHYARLRSNISSGYIVQVLLDVEIDYSGQFEASNQNDWHEEYKKNIKPMVFQSFGLGSGLGGSCKQKQKGQGLDDETMLKNQRSELYEQFDGLYEQIQQRKQTGENTDELEAELESLQQEILELEADLNIDPDENWYMEDYVDSDNAANAEMEVQF